MSAVQEMQDQSLGGEDSLHGNSLQFSCLENSMDEESEGLVYGVAKSQTRLK